MKKILYLVGGLIGLVVIGVLVVPNFIDWNTYKPDITNQVRKLTGRELTIAGDIDLKVLPSPKLVAEKVSLSSIDGAQSPDLVTLRSVEIRIAMAPLLAGNVVIETVQLVQPQVFMEVLADGRTSWTLALPEQKALPQDDQTASGASSEGDGSSGPNITLGNFEIVDGTVSYQDAGAKTNETISDIDLNVVAASLESGPYHADGSFVRGGLRLGVDVNVGEIVGGRTFPLDLSVLVGGKSAKVALTGTVLGLDDAPRFRGDVNVSSENIGHVVSALANGAKLPAPLSQSFNLSGSLDASAKALNVDNLKIDFGGAKGTGNISGAFNGSPKLAIKLNIDKVDADPWLLAEQKMEAESAAAAKNDATAPVVGTAVPEKPEPFVMPANMTASAEVKIGEVSMRGDKITNAILNAELADGILNLGQFSLIAPGGSDLAVFGALSAKDGKPTFDGQLQAKSTKPRTLMSWLGIEPAALKAGMPGAVSLDVAATATPEVISVRKLLMTVDQTNISGAATIALRDRLGIGASVNVNQLDLDAYLADAKAAAPEPKTSDETTETATPTKPAPSSGGMFDALNPLTKFDANVIANVGSLKTAGVTAKNIAADVSLVQGNLTIRKFNVGNALSVATNVSGEILGLGGMPKAKGLSVRANVGDPARLAAFVGAELPVPAKSLGKISFASNIDGNLISPKINSTLNAMDATVSTSGQLKLLSLADMFDVNVKVSHADTASLLRRLGVDYRPVGKIGGLNISTDIKGGLDAFTFSKLAAAFGAAKINGEGTVTLAGVRPKIATTLSSGNIVVDPFLPAKKSASYLPTAPARVMPARFWVPENGQIDFKHLIATISERWSTVPVDLSGLRAVDADITLNAPRISFREYNLDGAKVLAGLNNGVLNMNEFSGVVFGGTVMSNATINASGKTPTLGGLLTVGDMDIGAASKAAGIAGTTGSLTTRIDVSSAGRSVAQWVSALDGKGAIQVKGIKGESSLEDMPIVGLALGPLLQIFELLNSGLGSLIGAGGKTGLGETDVTSTFTIANGIINTKDTKIISNIYEGNVAGDINLPLWSMNVGGDVAVDQGLLGAVLANVARIPSKIPFQVTGNIDKPNVKIQSFTGASSAGGGGIQIPGLDKLEKKVPGVGGLLQGILGGGSTSSSQSAPAPQQSAPPPQQPQPQQQQQKKLEPADLLRKLLQ